MKTKTCSVLLALALLVGVLPVSAMAANTPFADVSAGAYYAEAVDWAVEQSITTGTSDTTFSPENGCTRGQVVTFLWRRAGKPAVSQPAAFSDVSADAYYADAVAWAVEQGITNGTGETTFSPDDTCTRGQIVTFLWRYAGKGTAASSGAFRDVSADAYYSGAVAWAVDKNITNGTGDSTFSPEGTCTRGQIVTFLWRHAGLPGHTHSWQTVTGPVKVKDGYWEDVYEKVPVYEEVTTVDGRVFNTLAEQMDYEDSLGYGATPIYGTTTILSYYENVLVDCIWHDPVYETKTYTACSACGATR